MGLIKNDSAVKLISGQLGAFAKLDNFGDLFEIAFGKERIKFNDFHHC